MSLGIDESDFEKIRQARNDGATLGEKYARHSPIQRIVNKHECKQLREAALAGKSSADLADGGIVDARPTTVREHLAGKCTHDVDFPPLSHKGKNGRVGEWVKDE